MYAPSKYGKHPAHCSQCRTNFVPPVENPPRPTPKGLRVACPQCSHDFIWSLPRKYTVWCDDCGLTYLIARRKPEWDDDGAYAVPCPDDDCDGHLRKPKWHDRRRRQRERREREEQPPDDGELVPEPVSLRERLPTGAVELPLHKRQLTKDENPLPSTISEAKEAQRRETDRILNGERRRDRP